MFRLLFQLAPSGRWVAQASLNIAQWVYRHPQASRLLARRYQDTATSILRNSPAESTRASHDDGPRAFLSQYSNVATPSLSSQQSNSASPCRPLSPPDKAN